MKDVDDMTLVAEIADAGRSTQAGVRLGIPKSTVSQRVRLIASAFARNSVDVGLIFVDRGIGQFRLPNAF